jgi:hypothetical protein
MEPVTTRWSSRIALSSRDLVGVSAQLELHAVAAPLYLLYKADSLRGFHLPALLHWKDKNLPIPLAAPVGVKGATVDSPVGS